ncbi:MAG TPA: phage tail protein [Candidatus Sulfotelmatobacter sp.]|nr:phage tail protein [Candidatus Sulfotelmatobacter sp.]
MALTAWTRELGATQGRIMPRGFVPPEGTFAFVLGRDLPGLTQRLVVGDFVEVHQTADFGGASFVRFRARMRPPAALPPGVAWRASVLVDGTERASAVLTPGRTRDRADLAADVSKLSGGHNLVFRLELTGTATTPVEVELPAFYVDAVLLDPTPSRPAVLSRDPEPNEVEVPIGTAVTFDLVDVGPDGIDVGATQVFVAGVPAFAGGAFRPGFNGPGSSATTPQPDTLRLVIAPTAPFDSLEHVNVRVVTQTVGGAFLLDTGWAFDCQDLTAPIVVGAQARELKRVRVSFDESVKQAAGTDLDDALNPASYSLTRLSAPAVDAHVIGVESATMSAVDLLSDLELTPGASYRVDVTGVVDAFGNVIAAPDNTASFTGFLPPRPANRVFDLYGLVAEINRREDDTGDLQRFLACLQEVSDLLLHDVDAFTDIFDPDLAPEWTLDLMLSDLGDPFPFDLSIADKRRLINVLVAIYREKGTAVGITNAIRFFLGLEVEIDAYSGEALVLGESLLGVDWILGPSGPFSAYAFEVIAPRALADEERRRLRQIVTYMKPAHTHFVRLVEPAPPEIIDHVELGLSELGDTWILH